MEIVPKENFKINDMELFFGKIKSYEEEEMEREEAIKEATNNSLDRDPMSALLYFIALIVVFGIAAYLVFKF